MECLSDAGMQGDAGGGSADLTDTIMKAIGYIPNPPSMSQLNKAIFTLDVKSTSILVVNNVAVKMLGYSSEEFSQMSFLDLFYVQPDLGPGHISIPMESGSTSITLNGKVVEFVCNGGDVIPVSLWIKRLEVPDRILAVIEPVERHAARILIDGGGLLLGMDTGAEVVFNCQADSMIGEPVTLLIPALGLEAKKQLVCGRSRAISQHVFPLTLRLSKLSTTFSADIHVFPSACCLLVINACSIIQSCNHHMTQTMFGFPQSELLAQPITTLLPDFCQSVISCSITLSDLGTGRSEGIPSQASLYYSALEPVNSSEEDTPTASPHNEFYETAESSVEMFESSSDEDEDDVVYTRSTPIKMYKEEGKGAISQGMYTGFGRHRDGQGFKVDYRVKELMLMEEEGLYLVWIRLANNTSTSTGTLGSELHSSTALHRCYGDSLRSRNHSNVSGKCSRIQDSDLSDGAYGEKYTNLQQIGSGAFGVVKIARFNPDEQLVVTKFITKRKIKPSLIVEDPTHGLIPLEVSILRKLDHPHIVKVLDVYQNKDYHILVMEKQANGMDLFDFINQMNADEPLNSYIFRQIVSALQYLHSKSIIHRDIKDENIIIDYSFHAKLIDFGSAAYMKEGGLFSTFSGTVQYCSPEVLEGNHYAGPELDMWALGVTLYTMAFHDSPFNNIEDTIRGAMQPFPPATSQLIEVLKGMLARDVKRRSTIEQVTLDEWTQQLVDISSYSFEEMIASGSTGSRCWSHYNGATDISTTSNNSTTVDNFDSEEEEAQVVEVSDDSCSSLESIERQCY